MRGLGGAVDHNFTECVWRCELNRTKIVLFYQLGRLTVLRISRLTDYGTVVLAHLARDKAGLVSAAEVATATGIAASGAPSR